MLRPSILGENLFEDFFDFPDFDKMEQQMNRKLINVQLLNGYLTISAARGLDKDEQDKDTGRYIRRERYAGR